MLDKVMLGQNSFDLEKIVKKKSNLLQYFILYYSIFILLLYVDMFYLCFDKKLHDENTLKIL